MTPIAAALALWRTGIASSSAVVEWADEEIATRDIPSMELIALSVGGPAACLRLPEYDYPDKRLDLTFEEEFGLRGAFVPLDSEEAVLAFARWAARYSLGEDLPSEPVTTGYYLDHLLTDCDDAAGAIAFLRDRLVEVVGPHLTRARLILATVPNLRVPRPNKALLP